MEIPIHAIFDPVHGQNRSRYQNIVMFLILELKTNYFYVMSFALNIFSLKFVSNVIFHPKVQNWSIDMFVYILTPCCYKITGKQTIHL